jgi:outer membrane lipoprotein SlyB
MDTQGKQSNRVIIWTACIALTLFCAAGIAAILGWIPTSMGGSTDKVASTQHDQPRSSTLQYADRKGHSSADKTIVPPRVVSTPPKAACADCGIIESTREVQAHGEGSGLGAAGGAIVGGLLGHQVGGGRGQDLATVVGAVGGAVGGNQIEKSMKSAKSYEIVVRLDDGSSRTIQQAAAPTWRSGDRVRLIDGVIHANN